MDLSKPDTLCVYCGTDLEEMKALRAEVERLEKVVEWARKVDDNLYEAHKIEGTEALNGLHDALAALDAAKEGK